MAGEFFQQKRLELVGAVLGQDPGPGQGHPLDGLVHGIAAGEGFRRLAGPVELSQVQDIAGIDGVGIAHPAFDACDRQFERAARNRRLRPGARSMVGRGPRRGIQGAGEIEVAQRPLNGHRGRLGMGPAGQHFQPPEPARLDRRLTAAAVGMDEDDLFGTGGLDEVLGGLAQTALGRRQAEGLAHGAGQEGVGRGGIGPDALLQPGEDHPVGPHQPRLNGPEDAQPGLVGPAGANGLFGQELMDQGGELGRRNGPQGGPALDQGRDQAGGGLAVGPGPAVRPGESLDQTGQVAGGGIEGRVWREGGRGPGRQGLKTVDEGVGCGQARQRAFGRELAVVARLAGAGQGLAQTLPAATARATQSEVFQRLDRDLHGLVAEVETDEGMFQQPQQDVRIQRFGDEADAEVDQPTGGHP